jgi:hypothetical protein
MNLDNKNKSLVDKIHEVCKCARSSARTYASTIRRIGDQFGGGYKKDLKFLHKPDILEKIKKTGCFSCREKKFEQWCYYWFEIGATHKIE